MKSLCALCVNKLQDKKYLRVSFDSPSYLEHFEDIMMKHWIETEEIT